MEATREATIEIHDLGLYPDACTGCLYSHTDSPAAYHSSDSEQHNNADSEYYAHAHLNGDIYAKLHAHANIDVHADSEHYVHTQ